MTAIITTLLDTLALLLIAAGLGLAASQALPSVGGLALGFTTAGAVVLCGSIAAQRMRR